MYSKVALLIAAGSVYGAQAQGNDPYDLIYNPDDGSLQIDTAGGPLVLYDLAGGPFDFQNQLSVLNPSGPSPPTSSTETRLTELFFSSTSFASPLNIGQVLPQGLNAQELQLFITADSYVPVFGEMGRPFDIVALAPTPTAAPQNSWLAAVDGDWLEPANWSLNQSPIGLPRQDVSIDAVGAPYTVTLDQGVPIKSLTLDSPDATVAVRAGTGTNSLLISDQVQLTRGVLAVNGGVSVPALVAGPDATLQSATFTNDLTVSGQLTFERIEAQNITLDQATIINRQSLDLTGTLLGTGTVLFDRPGGTFAPLSIDIGDDQSLGAGVHFRTDSGRGSIFGSMERVDSRFTLVGADDTLLIRGMRTFAGQVRLEAGQFTISNADGVTELAEQASFEFLGGKLLFNGGSFDLGGGTLDLTDPLANVRIETNQISNGRIRTSAESEVRIFSGLDNITLAGPVTMARGTVGRDGGSPVLTLDNAEIALVGDLGSFGESPWSIQGVGEINLTRVNPRNGPLERGRILYGDIQGTIGPDITVRTFFSGAEILGQGPLINQGTLIADGVGNTFEIAPASFRNEGTILAANGALIVIGGRYTLADLGSMQITGEDSRIVLNGEIPNAGQVFDLTTLQPGLTLNATIRGGTIYSEQTQTQAWGAVTLENTSITGTLVLGSETTRTQIDALSDIRLVSDAELRLDIPNTSNRPEINLFDSSGFTGSGKVAIDRNGAKITSFANEGNRFEAGVTFEHRSGRLDIESASSNPTTLEGDLISTASESRITITGPFINAGSISVTNGTWFDASDFRNEGVMTSSGEGTYTDIYRYTPTPGSIISVSDNTLARIQNIDGLGNYQVDNATLQLELGRTIFGEPFTFGELSDIGQIQGTSGELLLGGWIDLTGETVDIATLAPIDLGFVSGNIRSGQLITSTDERLKIEAGTRFVGTRFEVDLDVNAEMRIDGVSFTGLSINGLAGPDDPEGTNSSRTRNDLSLNNDTAPSIFEDVRLGVDLVPDTDLQPGPIAIFRGTIDVDPGFKIKTEETRYEYEGDFELRSGLLSVLGRFGEVSTLTGPTGASFTLGPSAEILMEGGSLDLGAADHPVTIDGRLESTRSGGSLNVTADQFVMNGNALRYGPAISINANQIDLNGRMELLGLFELDSPTVTHTGQLFLQNTIDISSVTSFDNFGTIAAASGSQNARILGTSMTNYGSLQALTNSRLTIDGFTSAGGSMLAVGGEIVAPQITGDIAVVQAFEGGRIELGGQYTVGQIIVGSDGQVTLGGDAAIGSLATVLGGRLDLLDAIGLIDKTAVYNGGRLGFNVPVTTELFDQAFVQLGGGVALLPGGVLDLMGQTNDDIEVELDGGELRNGTLRFGASVAVIADSTIRDATLDRRDLMIAPGTNATLARTTLHQVDVLGEGQLLIEEQALLNNTIVQSDIQVLPNQTLTFLDVVRVNGSLTLDNRSAEQGVSPATLALDRANVGGEGTFTVRGGGGGGPVIQVTEFAGIRGELSLALDPGSDGMITIEGPEAFFEIDSSADFSLGSGLVQANLDTLSFDGDIRLDGDSAVQVDGDLVLVEDFTDPTGQVLQQGSAIHIADNLIPGVKPIIQVTGQVWVAGAFSFDLGTPPSGLQTPYGIYNIIEGQSLTGSFEPSTAKGTTAFDLIWQLFLDETSARVVAMLPGDVDLDGDIDDADLATLFSNYTGALSNGDLDITQGDTDGDGDIDDADLGNVFSDYTGALSSPVPEPGATALLALGGLILSRRRHSMSP